MKKNDETWGNANNTQSSVNNSDEFSGNVVDKVRSTVNTLVDSNWKKLIHIWDMWDFPIMISEEKLMSFFSEDMLLLKMREYIEDGNLIEVAKNTHRNFNDIKIRIMSSTSFEELMGISKEFSEEWFTSPLLDKANNLLIRHHNDKLSDEWLTSLVYNWFDEKNHNLAVRKLIERQANEELLLKILYRYDQYADTKIRVSIIDYILSENPSKEHLLEIFEGNEYSINNQSTVFFDKAIDRMFNLNATNKELISVFEYSPFKIWNKIKDIATQWELKQILKDLNWHPEQDRSDLVSFWVREKWMNKEIDELKKEVESKLNNKVK